MRPMPGYEEKTKMLLEQCKRELNNLESEIRILEKRKEELKAEVRGYYLALKRCK